MPSAELELIIPTDMLKLIYGGASSAAMELKSILMTVEDNRLIVRHVNDSNTALMNFKSVELKIGTPTVRLPIDTADLKTMVNLAKDYPSVTFLIGDGYTVCKLGKIKKQFTQPDFGKVPDRDPKFDVTTTIEFNDEQNNSILATFLDIKEKGDLRINATQEGIVFSIKEDNRSTEIEFSPADTVSFVNTAQTAAGYGLEGAISFFKAKQKGNILKFEFGNDVPVRVTQETPQGTLAMILAPKIYND
jgi:hypothetical protein